MTTSNNKNADNKSLATAINDQLRNCLPRTANKIQNGFVKGRQLAINPIILDSQPREPQTD